MRAAYDKLLEEVCVRLGCCGSVVDGQPLPVDQFLPEDGVQANEAFADALFGTEGWDPGGPKPELSVTVCTRRSFSTWAGPRWSLASQAQMSNQTPAPTHLS